MFANSTTSASSGLPPVPTLPPSAVSASGCGKGASTSADSRRRSQTGKVHRLQVHAVVAQRLELRLRPGHRALVGFASRPCAGRLRWSAIRRSRRPRRCRCAAAAASCRGRFRPCCLAQRGVGGRGREVADRASRTQGDSASARTLAETRRRTGRRLCAIGLTRGESRAQGVADFGQQHDVLGRRGRRPALLRACAAGG